MKYFSLIIILVFVFVPDIASAQSTQLVTCSGIDCNFCSFTQMVDGIIQWLIGILVLIAVLLLAWAGMKMVISAGNPSAAQEAKGMLVNVLIGFVIVLASWTIVDTMLKALAGGDLGVWNPVECGGMFQPLRGSSGATLDVSAGGDAGGADVGGSAVPTGNLVSYAGRQFDSGVVSNMQYIAETFNLRVTSGYRTPEHNASVGGVSTSYHLTGRAGDFVGSAADMLAAENWARANGAIEVLRHNVTTGYHLHAAF